MTLDGILLVFGALVGWPALVALVIDVLKLAGVVNDGTAGKWSLGLNLFGFIAVGVAVGFYPQVDIPGIDARLLEIVQIAAYILTVLAQIFVTRQAHFLYAKTPAGAKYGSYSTSRSEISDRDF